MAHSRGTWKVLVPVKKKWAADFADGEEWWENFPFAENLRNLRLMLLEV
jgi:hypothetical protein